MNLFSRRLAATGVAAACVIAAMAAGPASAAGSVATTTKLSATPAAPLAGQTVTFYAKVAPSVVGAVPTGTVTFTVDGVAQSPVTVTPSTKTVGDGQATIAETWNTIGSHTVLAQYNGDATYAASTSTSLPITVAPEPTTLAVTSSLNPSTLGQTIKLYAKISEKFKSAVPTGTITFTIDGAASSPVPVNLSHGTLSISTLSHGTHTVTAHYSGDSSHLASTSGVFTQTVN